MKSPDGVVEPPPAYSPGYEPQNMGVPPTGPAPPPGVILHPQQQPGMGHPQQPGMVHQQTFAPGQAPPQQYMQQPQQVVHHQVVTHQVAGAPQTVVTVGNCPSCHASNMIEETHPAGIILAIILYFVLLGPFSLLFLLWKRMRCPRCGYAM